MVEIGETILERRTDRAAALPRPQARCSRRCSRNRARHSAPSGWWSFRRPAMWSLVFLSTAARTGHITEKLPSEDEYVSAFMPCTPNPTTGFFFYVLKRDVIELELLGRGCGQAADERRHDPAGRQSGTAPQARGAGAKARARSVRWRTNRSGGVARPGAPLRGHWPGGGHSPRERMEGSIARLDGLPAHVASVLSDFAARRGTFSPAILCRSCCSAARRKAGSGRPPT